MSGQDKTPDKGGKPPSAASDDRAERLRAALRANLRRRKEQARGRVTPRDDEAPHRGGRQTGE